MTGYRQFIFPVAVIDIAMLDQPAALRLPCLVRYFDREIHFIAIHFAARHLTNPMSTVSALTSI